MNSKIKLINQFILLLIFITVFLSCKKDKECIIGNLQWQVICSDCEMSICGNYCSFDLYVDDNLIGSIFLSENNNYSSTGGGSNTYMEGSHSFKIVNVDTGETVKEFDSVFECDRQPRITTSINY